VRAWQPARPAFQTNQPALVELLNLVQSLTDGGAAPATPAELLTQVRKLLQDSAATDSLIDSFVLSFSFEPVGRIHLERMEMTPVGVEHGELVYSVPLTPKETVNITHREWSNTTSTFENLVGDFFEGYSERGVADKTDVGTAVSNESKHSSPPSRSSSPCLMPFRRGRPLRWLPGWRAPQRWVLPAAGRNRRRSGGLTEWVPAAGLSAWRGWWLLSAVRMSCRA